MPKKPKLDSPDHSKVLDEISHHLSELDLSFKKLQDTVKSNTKRVDVLQKTVDLLSQDRDILEDLQGGLRSVEEVLLANREHNRSHIKDLKADVRQVEAKVELEAGNVKDKIEEIPKETVEEMIDESKKGKGFLKKITKIFRR